MQIMSGGGVKAAAIRCREEAAEKERAQILCSAHCAAVSAITVRVKSSQYLRLESANDLAGRLQACSSWKRKDCLPYQAQLLCGESCV